MKLISLFNEPKQPLHIKTWPTVSLHVWNCFWMMFDAGLCLYHLVQNELASVLFFFLMFLVMAYCAVQSERKLYILNSMNDFLAAIDRDEDPNQALAALDARMAKIGLSRKEA